MKQIIKNQKIIIPIIVGVIAIVAIIISVSIKDLTEKEFQLAKPPISQDLGTDSSESQDESEQPKHLPKEQETIPEPEENCMEEFNPNIDYNFLGSLDLTSEEPPTQFLVIGKDGMKRTFSLGKFRLHLPPYAGLRIPKIWLSFYSETLSDRDDEMYGLEDAYLSKIIFKRGTKTKEVNLGTGETHSFMELRCPLGSIEPVNYKTYIDFEFFLEMSCNNLKNGTCFDNEGKPLDYINNADLLTRIRIFATSMQEFTKDIPILVNFKYE